MIEDNDIDDLFRNGLDSHESEVPDKIWNSLDRVLDKKAGERYRGIIFRLRLVLVLFILLSCVSATYYFLNDQPTKSVILAELLSNQKQDISGATDKLMSSSERSKKETVGTQEEVVMPDATVKSARSIINSESESRRKVARDFKTPISKAAIPDPIEKSVKKQLPILTENPDKNRNSESFTEDRSENSVAQKNDPVSEDKNSGGIDPQIKPDSATFFEEKNNQDNQKDKNPTEQNSLSKIPLQALPTQSFTKEAIDSLTRRRFKDKLSLVAYFSPDLTMNYRQNNNEVDDHEEDYNSEEVSDFSYNAGILAGYDLTKNWTLRFGATYSYLAQIIKPKVAYARMGADGLIHYQFNTSYGSTPLVSDMNYTPVVGDSLKILSNSFQSLQIISIPLIAKYQIVKNKFSFYAQAGLNGNFIAGERLIISVPGQHQSVQKIEGLNKFYLGGIAGLGVAYTPYKKLSIMLEPTVRGAITSINKHTPVITRPFSLGLSIGVGWHF